MESKSDMEKGTPGKRRQTILLEKPAPNKYYSFGCDSPFRLLPSTSTPPSRIIKITNPFESQLTERLHLSVFSPSVFNNMQSSKTEEKFKWTIEEISSLKPADIDEATVDQYEVHDHDSDIEFTAQAQIESYFNDKQIVPSPFDVVVTNVPLISESGKQHGFKDVSDGTAQTILTLPPILPDHIETILKPFFSYTVDQQQANNNTNSLYRRLFESGDDEHSSSESVLTSPAPSDISTAIDLSPPYNDTKTQSQRNFGSPNDNEMGNCNLSPITSTSSELSVRASSISRLNFSGHMSVDTSLNLVPDTLDQMPSNNQSLAFESMHSPVAELLSNSEVNWDLEYKHVSLASPKSSEDEMDVSNSNTPKSKIFISQRKKLSDSFLKIEESDEDKENIYNINQCYERRHTKSNLYLDSIPDAGYHTGSLTLSEESFSSSHLYASTPTKNKK